MRLLPQTPPFEVYAFKRVYTCDTPATSPEVLIAAFASGV